MSKTFQTISGAELMDKPLEPIRFIVDTLIPQGLHILAGSPKIGKSWLVLWICLKVANGEDVWNLKTEKGTTLYLGLEDSIARIQSRLYDITEDASSDVHFATVAESIGNGIEEQIYNFYSNHPDTNLIVIDTFQKIRMLSNDNAYAADYKDIAALKSIADRLKIAILIIHHLRKQKDDDPMNMVSGTTGITGAVDSSYVLDKSKRHGDTATLYCTGRDIEYRELDLNFNKQTKLWNLEDDSMEHPEIMLPDIVGKVYEFIKKEKIFVGTPSELLTELSAYTSEETTPNVLSKKLIQSADELQNLGINYGARRSNGRRLIQLEFVGLPQNEKNFVGRGEPTEQMSFDACNETNTHSEVRRSVESDDNSCIPITDPVDPEFDKVTIKLQMEDG